MSSLIPESLISTFQTALMAHIAGKITDPCKSDSKPDVQYICCCGNNLNREMRAERYPMATIMSHHSENFKPHAHRNDSIGNCDTDCYRGYGRAIYQTHWATEHRRPYYDRWQVRLPRQYAYKHSHTEWIVHDYNHGITRDYIPRESSVSTTQAKRAALYTDRSRNDVTVRTGKTMFKENIKDDHDYIREEQVHMSSKLSGNIRKLSDNQLMRNTAVQENSSNVKNEKCDDEKEIARERNIEDVSKDVVRSEKILDKEKGNYIKKEIPGSQTSNENNDK